MRCLLVVLAACGAAPAKPQPIANTVPAEAPPPPAATLVVTALDPASGDIDGGSYVRILGHGFLDPPRQAKIWFGSAKGTIIRFASDTELIAEAPGGKLGEVVDVLVVFEPGGEIKLPKAFTFVDKQPPVILP
jgi:hypothetical protein